MKRRDCLKWMGGASALGCVGNSIAASKLHAGVSQSVRRAGSAENCIFLWLGGGACHIDTFDPKRVSKGPKDPGSYYASVDTAIPGVQLCEHLSRTAKLLDRCAVVRTLNHNVVDEHAAATNRVHTGRPPADSTVYPSIGSIVSHELGAVGDGVPAYVVAGYPWRPCSSQIFMRALPHGPAVRV